MLESRRKKDETIAIFGLVSELKEDPGSTVDTVN